MNKLPLKTRTQILNMLCEGSSMRSISRVADVSINTVSKLLVDAGKFCAALHDREVRNVKAKRVRCDEIWSFTAAKQRKVAAMKNPVEGAGDTWTWTALGSDSKLIISWLVGGRDGEYALAFMDDVKERLANRVQLTTDGHKAYLNAVEEAFGADIDYAMLVKMYGEPEGKAVPQERRYSPAVCTGAKKTRIEGSPDLAHVSTSHVERQNLTMRMQMRRFTRLTNAFSKKFENHVHMVALYTVWYNFIRIHKTLKMSPAMAAGLSQTLCSMDDVCAKMDAIAPKPGKRGPYKKQVGE
ncbi:MAG: IS1 family transposase [Mesorhizobium sp.]|uniref:IS1 family transposase n=1 Tax=Mesorhizobium sp. TaxID=1871066 RepID=UPI000FE87C91|nr:IS1 family transposase [Mesorhizobium sp.]RWD32158.1 MAG: IS1 family transposase [Mesorhizobium sp.]RWQ29765.1 MAG: IS1 family transposase [Mesorhizobium sp.]TIL22004.1 MAG: IS1 family transposase [Mesorhizobium sp.]